MDKKKRKKFSWKRFKRIMKNLGKVFKEEILNFLNKIKNLSTPLKNILKIWILIFIIILVMLIVCNSNNKMIAKHQKIENAVKIAAQEFVKKEELYSSANQRLNVDMNVLLDNGFLDSSKVTDKTCNGYASIYWNEKKEEYVIESYINCKRYTTDGYKENKE